MQRGDEEWRTGVRVGSGESGQEKEGRVLCSSNASAYGCSYVEAVFEPDVDSFIFAERVADAG